MICELPVRIAKPDDKTEILRLFLQAHHENGLFPFEFEKVDWWVNRMLYPELIPPTDMSPRGVIGVIGNGNLEGLAMLTVGCFWYAAQRHLEEFLVYVDSEVRRGGGGGHLKALVGWMKEQSALTGLPLMTGILSTHRTAAKVKLYESMLPKAGAFFFYSPTQGSSAAYVH